jgi:hypothetical protein
MKILFCLTLCLVLSGVAAANPLGGIGTWRGSGTVFDTAGREVGSFKVELARTAVDANIVEAKGQVTFENGQRFPIEQRITSHGGNTFKLETPSGKGGGLCVGEGLCQSYEDVGGDKAYATTLVIDGRDRMRLITTELDHGRAVRFTRQALERSQ